MENQNQAPVEVLAADVLRMLNEGKTRKEIAEHYGLPESVMRETVWQHPELKGKKTKKQYNVVVVGTTESPTDTITHTVTDTDLDNNPDLVGQVEVGEEVQIPAEAVTEETSSGKGWSRTSDQQE